MKQDDETTVEEAERICRKHYWDHIRSMAEEAVDDSDDEEELDTWIHQTVDGQCCYNHRNLDTLRFTDNDAAWEDMGELPGDHWQALATMAYWAMYTDVMDFARGAMEEKIEKAEEAESA